MAPVRKFQAQILIKLQNHEPVEDGGRGDELGVLVLISVAVNLLQELWREDGHDEVCLGAPLHAAALGVREHLVPQARLV